MVHLTDFDFGFCPHVGPRSREKLGTSFSYGTSKDGGFERVLMGLMTPAVHKERLFSLYSLALTRMSFKDFPLRYDRRGGSLKIFFSCGWFCIKCHFH